MIKSALEEKGIGAKTAVGYGYFSNEENEDNKSMHFKKAYDSLLKQDKIELENAKPLYQKIIENIAINLNNAFEFIQNGENPINDKQKVIEKMQAYFQNNEIWEKKKLNGQQFNFAADANRFLMLSNQKDEKIISFIKKYGSKKLKKKYK